MMKKEEKEFKIVDRCILTMADYEEKKQEFENDGFEKIYEDYTIDVFIKPHDRSTDPDEFINCLKKILIKRNTSYSKRGNVINRDIVMTEQELRELNL